MLTSSQGEMTFIHAVRVVSIMRMRMMSRLCRLLLLWRGRGVVRGGAYGGQDGRRAGGGGAGHIMEIIKQRFFCSWVRHRGRRPCGGSLLAMRAGEVGFFVMVVGVAIRRRGVFSVFFHLLIITIILRIRIMMIVVFQAAVLAGSRPSVFIPQETTDSSSSWMRRRHRRSSSSSSCCTIRLACLWHGGTPFHIGCTSKKIFLPIVVPLLSMPLQIPLVVVLVIHEIIV